jgi:hypothetical protein
MTPPPYDSSMAPDSTFAFVGGPWPFTRFVIPFWITIAFYKLLTSLFCILRERIAHKCSMYMWDHISMMKYDPATCPRKELHKNVKCIIGIIWNMATPFLTEKIIPQEFLYLGSFFNVEIWPPSLVEKRIPQEFLYLGSFFNVEI